MRDHREGMKPDVVDISALVREHSGQVSRPERRQRAKPIQTKVYRGGSKARKILRGQR